LVSAALITSWPGYPKDIQGLMRHSRLATTMRLCMQSLIAGYGIALVLGELIGAVGAFLLLLKLPARRQA
jgi:hypothetical protein